MNIKSPLYHIQALHEDDANKLDVLEDIYYDLGEILGVVKSDIETFKSKAPLMAEHFNLLPCTHGRSKR